MNGSPLPLEHGFPVRMVVPGLYGYVSATKWVVELRVTRFADATAYWTDRGWSAKGPIKTESRIDVPTDGARVTAGTVAVAGVAWAQHTGIERVEVRVDDGAWLPARLATAISTDTWVQWVYEWEANAGDHVIRVRATDAAGMTQRGTNLPPAPDGAEGWHTVRVTAA
jgi:DMSO/TMAO reductase YedYZ molybdopterin-dependent catalytic subunit